MALIQKPVILTGQKIGMAATLRQAAEVAKANGVPVIPDYLPSIVQHVGEGPHVFNVVRTAGERIP